MINEWPTLSPIRTGLRGLCPQCGQGHLFSGFMTVKPKCEVCGVDYSSTEPTDRLGFIVACFICITGVALAFRIQVAYSPSIWVHLFTALPPVLVTLLLPLRPLKGWMMNRRFRFTAEKEKSRQRLRSAEGA